MNVYPPPISPPRPQKPTRQSRVAGVKTSRCDLYIRAVGDLYGLGGRGWCGVGVAINTGAINCTWLDPANQKMDLAIICSSIAASAPFPLVHLGALFAFRFYFSFFLFLLFLLLCFLSVIFLFLVFCHIIFILFFLVLFLFF